MTIISWGTQSWAGEAGPGTRADLGVRPQLSGSQLQEKLTGIKVVERLFHAVSQREPVVFSVVRPGVPVLRRGDGVPAREAVNGASISGGRGAGEDSVGDRLAL